MSTASQRLVQLSGLATGTAAAHLIAISQSGNTAGERLLSYSSLSSATAAQHLLDEGAVTGVSGSLAALESQDLFAANGSLLVSGVFAGEDQPDAFVSIGGVAVTGAWTVAEVGDDSLAAIGRTIASATFSAAEVGADQFVAAGSARIAGLLSTGDAPDAMSASGTVVWAVFTGDLASQESTDDLLAVTAQALVAGPFAAVELQDSGSYSGAVLVQGQTALQELSDSLSADVDAVASGGLSVSERAEDDVFYAIDLYAFGQWDKIRSAIISGAISIDTGASSIAIDSDSAQMRVDTSASVFSMTSVVIQPTIDVQAQLLSLTYKLGLFLRTFSTTNTVSVDEQATHSLGKRAVDSISALDEHYFGVQRVTQDQSFALEQHALSLIKHLGEDAFTAIDNEVVSFAKALQDSPALQDVLRREISKTMAETASALDVSAKALSKPMTSAAATIEQAAHEFGKQLFSSVHFSDSASLLRDKGLYDPVGVTDDVDGALSIEDDQSVIVFKSSSDSALVSESFASQVSYIRQFLDPSSVSDSQNSVVELFKSELVVFTETVQVDLSRSREVLNFLTTVDSEFFAYSKRVTDALGALDSYVSHVFKGVNEGVTLSETTSRSQLLPKFDTVGIASSGTLLSQGYCEASYFAEDYVGSSRSFT